MQIARTKDFEERGVGGRGPTSDDLVQRALVRQAGLERFRRRAGSLDVARVTNIGPKGWTSNNRFRGRR